MKKSQYFVRVLPDDNDSFQDYMERNGIEGKFVSIDLSKSGGGMMYSVQLTHEEASTMRLSFNLSGFLNLNRALDRQVESRNAKIAATNSEQS